MRNNKIVKAALLLVVACVAWGHFALASIPLTVKCRFDRANDQSDIDGKSENLWVFVLDHSGSMGNNRDAYSIKRGAGSVLRWTALKDSFE